MLGFEFSTLRASVMLSLPLPRMTYEFQYILQTLRYNLSNHTLLHASTGPLMAPKAVKFTSDGWMSGQRSIDETHYRQRRILLAVFGT